MEIFLKILQVFLKANIKFINNIEKKYKFNQHKSNLSLTDYFDIFLIHINATKKTVLNEIFKLRKSIN